MRADSQQTQSTANWTDEQPMRIDAFQPVKLVSPGELGRLNGPETSLPTRETGVAGGTGQPGQTQEFSQVLGKELSRVNDVLAEGDRQAQLVATGQADDVQSAMTAMAEADLALQVTMKVTQKAIAAYQEVSRMQL
jgi:flagellar hook-basal body complex protein FliE